MLLTDQDGIRGSVSLSKKSASLEEKRESLAKGIKVPDQFSAQKRDRNALPQDQVCRTFGVTLVVHRRELRLLQYFRTRFLNARLSENVGMSEGLPSKSRVYESDRGRSVLPRAASRRQVGAIRVYLSCRARSLKDRR